MMNPADPNRHRTATPKRTAAADSRTNKRAITILLVDAHSWTREALARGLEAASRDLRVLRFADISELPKTAPQIGTGVLLLNLARIGLGDPHISAQIAAIHPRLPDLPLVVLSDDEDTDSIIEAVSCGLSGYIPMSLELRLVAHALRFVAAGGTFLPAELLLTNCQALTADDLTVVPLVDAPAPVAMVQRLTPRELAVLQLLGQGKSNKQIARELDAREATIKVHVRHIMRKLGAVNRTQVALLAEGLTVS